MHDRGGADHGEQRGDNEQLALAKAANQPEQWIEDQPADQHKANHCSQGHQRELPAGRSAWVRRHPRQRGDDRDHRNNREILEQQDRESALALRRVQLIVRAQHRQHLRGRRQAERKTDRERCSGRDSERRVQQPANGEAAQHHLRQAQTEDVIAQPPQSARLKLQPDNEQEQRDAEVGDAEQLLRVADQPHDLRTDQRAGDDVAQGGAELQLAE